MRVNNGQTAPTVGTPKDTGALKQSGVGISSFDEGMISATDGKLASLNASKAKASHEVSDKANSFASQSIFSPEDLARSLSLRANQKVVEFGCGAGNIILEIAKLVPEGEVYGVDVQKDLLLKMLRGAKERGFKNVFAVWGDLDNVSGSKLSDLTFDLVVMVNTFFQLENKETAIKEAYRILKPGGKLVIVDWSDKDAPIGPHKDHFVSKEEIIDLAVSNDFIFSNEEKMQDHHIKLTFNKKP